VFSYCVKNVSELKKYCKMFVKLMLFILKWRLCFTVVVVVDSLTPRSNPVEMPKSHEEATVVASTCNSMPYATFIEAAESGLIKLNTEAFVV